MIYLIILTSLLFLVTYYLSSKKKSVTPDREIIIPSAWVVLLQDKVSFYTHLNNEDKLRFQVDCFKFLNDVKIIGVAGVKVELIDRLLVASSAVIPLFGFPEWTYKSINEVVLYPSAFDRNFNLNNPNEIITGMVGSGIMEGKMILSKPALVYGFENDNDKDNVGIHEFVHLFDKEDGLIDGIPEGFKSNISTMVWVDLVKVKIREIAKNRSKIKEYGATNHQEFFAVASEYFFESPKLLEKKHPELYEMLAEVFNQDLASSYSSNQMISRNKPGRNQRCVCGSGEKYKHCCGELD